MMTIMPKQTPQMVNLKKKKSSQNFEGEANNKLLYEEDTQQSNLNSIHISLTLVLNIFIL